MIKVGVLGAGQVGQRHCRAIAQIEELALVAVADLNETRAQEAARGHEAACYTDYHAVLEQDLDAVVNSLPHNLHHESSLLAAERGLHMLLEKPMCLSIREGRDILQAYADPELQLMLGYVHRYRQEMLDAKALIDAGKLGQIANLSDNFCASGGAHVPRWVWRRAQAGGGVLMYGGIHAVDRARWFLDSEVTRVYARARTYSTDMDVEDGMVVFLEFESGATASLVMNSPRYASLGGWRTEVFGSRGNLVTHVNQSLAFSSDENRFVRTYERYDHFERQMREFAAAIAEQREPWVGGRDGLLSLAVVIAAYKSHQEHRPVTLNEVLDA
jgi:predicted dehydrogenase